MRCEAFTAWSVRQLRQVVLPCDIGVNSLERDTSKADVFSFLVFRLARVPCKRMHRHVIAWFGRVFVLTMRLSEYRVERRAGRSHEQLCCRCGMKVPVEAVSVENACPFGLESCSVCIRI